VFLLKTLYINMTVNGQIMTLLLVRDHSLLNPRSLSESSSKHGAAFNQIIEDRLRDSDPNSIVRCFAAVSGMICLHGSRLHFTAPTLAIGDIGNNPCPFCKEN
jgi:hypothetical protein